jgi:alkanesulfonate monooxygenase SsuD/methylene tetrahydromethanopterin reductase-like flavin-dependent oxidoreductase (luciferase family)
MHAVWRGEPVGDGGNPGSPRPVNGDRVPVMIGGSSERTISRAVKWGVGWTFGSGGPDMAAPLIEKLRAAWRAADREDEPRIAALAYFSLGADAEEDSRTYLRHYYAFLGEYADMIADGALRIEDAIAGAVKAFADVGVTEVYFDPTTTQLDQVDRLADVVGVVPVSSVGGG